jgi:hypothetical protein
VQEGHHDDCTSSTCAEPGPYYCGMLLVQMEVDCCFGYHVAKSTATLPNSRWCCPNLEAEADAIIFAQALETKLMEKRKNKLMTIMDPFTIALDVPCNVNKHQIVTLYFNNSCFISLDVLSVSHHFGISSKEASKAVNRKNVMQKLRLCCTN